VSERKSIPLRLDPKLAAALQKWAADDLRSLNGQIEFLLREALRKVGRLPKEGRPGTGREPPDSDEGRNA
jgi:hypothetical protein